MRYYPFSRQWSKVKPYISDKKVQEILIRDFNKYTMGLNKRPFEKGMVPADFEGCDWHCDRRGRRPAYWDYVKHAACHWLVNFNLELAKLVEPKEKWRILSSQRHSTVWNGKDILFDMNFSALQIPPKKAFNIANEKELPIGNRLRVYYANPHS